MQGGSDREDIHFRPRVVRVVDVWKDLDATLSSLGGVGSMFEPHPITTQANVVGVSHRAGWCRPGKNSFRPQVVKLVDIWMDV